MPLSFKDLVLKCDGGYPEPSRIFHQEKLTSESVIETVFSFLYVFSDPTSWKSIDKQTTSFQEICPNLIPFGCDFGDWVFVFDYREVKENPSVYLMRLDKEYPEGLLFVASDFDSFLKNIHA